MKTTAPLIYRTARITTSCFMVFMATVCVSHAGVSAIRHQTLEDYDFEYSIEKANQERDREKELKYQEYADAHSHHVCREQSCFDERTSA